MVSIYYFFLIFLIKLYSRNCFIVESTSEFFVRETDAMTHGGILFSLIKWLLILWIIQSQTIFKNVKRIEITMLICQSITYRSHRSTAKSNGQTLGAKPSNIAILLKIIKDNQNIDNISIIKNNKGYFK